jgi:Na+-translocating ferredoxin:NAD+ oxidoreductase subunit E
MRKLLKTFMNGLFIENRLTIIMIGLCSALAVTTTVANGIGMSVALIFVLVMSEVIISAFKKLIPDSIRIPIFIIVIAAFTTVMDLVMKAYFPELSKAMGVFIPLVVVNCIVMGRVEAFASKTTVIEAIFDAAGMGLGYAWVLVTMAIARELLGNGTVLGIQAMPASYQPILFFILPPGGFLVFALWMSINAAIRKASLAAAAKRERAAKGVTA